MRARDWEKRVLLDARLGLEAQRRAVVISEVTREVIEEHVGSHRGRRRLMAAGMGAGGRSDISEQTEEILRATVRP